jgi:hypothetical protein
MYGVENAYFKSYETDKFITEVLLEEQNPVDSLIKSVTDSIAAEKVA